MQEAQGAQGARDREQVPRRPFQELRGMSPPSTLIATSHQHTSANTFVPVPSPDHPRRRLQARDELPHLLQRYRFRLC